MDTQSLYRRPDPSKSLDYQIEDVYSKILELKKRTQRNTRRILNGEENAKVETLEEYAAAKNADVRQAILLQALAGDEAYQEARRENQEAAEALELYRIEVERLRLLVEARKAETA